MNLYNSRRVVYVPTNFAHVTPDQLEKLAKRPGVNLSSYHTVKGIIEAMRSNAAREAREEARAKAIAESKNWEAFNSIVRRPREEADRKARKEAEKKAILEDFIRRGEQKGFSELGAESLS